MGYCEFCNGKYPDREIYVKPKNCNDKFRVCSEEEAKSVSIFFLSRYDTKEVLTLDGEGNILMIMI